MPTFPAELFRIGPFAIGDTIVVTLVLSALLVVAGKIAIARPPARRALEVVYEVLENAVVSITPIDVRPLVPLVLTQWLFIGLANLVGLLPGVQSPTRDLSLSAALAVVSFGAGHAVAIRRGGLGYLRQYVEPSPFLLPFNVIGELSRTVALALRLFGNMVSSALVGAVFLYVAGLLVPVPIMLLGALTAVVQAYIFGVLTLVFAASSLETATRRDRKPKTKESPT